jgi:hypothetical protein
MRADAPFLAGIADFSFPKKPDEGLLQFVGRDMQATSMPGVAMVAKSGC